MVKREVYEYNSIPCSELFLLGGPGGGTDPKDRQFFDPSKYKVRSVQLACSIAVLILFVLPPVQIVLFDQRGSGKSTPSVLIY